MPATAAIAEAAVVMNQRRVSDAALPRVMTAIGPPPSNQRDGSCPRRLTEAGRFDDACVNHKSVTDRARGDTQTGATHMDRHRRVIDSAYLAAVTMSALAACAFGVVAAVLHVVSIAAVMHRIRRLPIDPSEAETAKGISIIRPVCGLENFSKETLSSAFR